MRGVKGSGKKKEPNHVMGRPKEEESKTFYARLKLKYWMKLKELGGKVWLIKKLEEELK